MHQVHDEAGCTSSIRGSNSDSAGIDVDSFIEDLCLSFCLVRVEPCPLQFPATNFPSDQKTENKIFLYFNLWYKVIVSSPTLP